MSKGPTKAQAALTEAREWIDAAKEEVRECEQALKNAQSQLAMHETIYAVLEKTFKRERKHPVKMATKKAGKKLSSKSSPPLACVYVFPDDDPWPGQTCTAFEDGHIHRDKSLTGYHRFVKPGKSSRASGMAAAIKRSLESQQRIAEPICATCGNVEDYADHSQPSPHYHPFVSPAQSAGGRSSTNGASSAPANSTRSTAKSTKLENDESDQSASSTGASSEEEMDSVGDARNASAGGD